MQADCFSFDAIPGSSRLFLDYLQSFPQVSRFYAASPIAIPNAIGSLPSAPSSPELRAEVADVLMEQNRRWGPSPATLANIERLRQGARAVVTGQQVVLFGGPAYVLYKALTAIKLAELARRQGRECVPVFWMATEDHDLAEVNHVTLPGSGGTLQRLTTASRGGDDAPVGAIPLDHDLEDLLGNLKQGLGEDNEIYKALQASYQPGNTFTDTFAQLLTRIFGEFGLVLVDPSHPRLHRASAALYIKVVAESASLNQALLDRNRELEAAGYHAQVKVTESTSLLFALRNGARIPIHRDGEGFRIAGQPLSASELQSQIADSPESFSPNALLRPVVQDHLFATLAYVGGPAEIAYLAQSQVLYERLLGRVTPVMPRLSATLIEPRIQQWLAKYHLHFADVMRSPSDLRMVLAKSSMPPELQQRFTESQEKLEAALVPLQQALRQLDSTIADAAETASRKMHYQLDHLKALASRAEMRRNAEIERHAQALWSSLYPENGLQERAIGGVYFLAKYGAALLQQLYEQVRPECMNHLLITL